MFGLGLLIGLIYVRNACLCLREPSYVFWRDTAFFQKIRDFHCVRILPYARLWVSERLALAIRESRIGADHDSRYRHGAGEGGGDASALGAGVECAQLRHTDRRQRL